MANPLEAPTTNTFSKNDFPDPRPDQETCDHKINNESAVYRRGPEGSQRDHCAVCGLTETV